MDQSELPASLQSFLEAGDPPIVFTPGSANCMAGRFFRAAVDACVAMHRRGVLLTRFSDQVPKNLPAFIAHFDYAPLSELLPRSAALISHGGIGSVSQAMAAGLPQLIMPLAHDQFDNAARVRRLSVGDSLEPRRFTGRRIARVLERLLASNKVLHACRSIRERLHGRDGLSRTAGALWERFAERNAKN
jgi:UDP:flavonoid glycosyltransferase YjiC (YdhE family)